MQLKLKDLDLCCSVRRSSQQPWKCFLQLKHLKVGTPEDRFHYQQGSTTVAARSKIQDCEGYLTMYCPDAARCLDLWSASNGSKTEAFAYVDLECFLDAAHGDEFEHGTQNQREMFLKFKLKVVNPGAQVPAVVGAHLNPTNVHIMLLQQNCVFAKYWAQLTARKPIGVAQRCLFAFGGDADPALMACSHFLRDLTVPIVKDFLHQLISVAGPRVTSVEPPHLIATNAQNATLAEIELIPLSQKRRPDVLDSFKGSLPKALYWIGIAVLTNSITSMFWRAALRSETRFPWSTAVSNAVWAASCRFAYKRYLFGQSVLAQSIAAQSWIGVDIPLKIVEGDLVPILLRVLRGCPHNVITRERILSLDIDLRLRLRPQAGQEKRERAEYILRSLWDMLVALGVGRMDYQPDGSPLLLKFHRAALCKACLEWLQQNRVLGCLFGVDGTRPDQEPQPGQQFEGKNPITLLSSSMLVAEMPQVVKSGSYLAVPDDTSQTCQRPKPSGPVNTLFHEIIEGALLTASAARARVRQELAKQNRSADIRYVKPLKHDRYYLFKGECLACSPQTSPVVFNAKVNMVRVCSHLLFLFRTLFHFLFRLSFISQQLRF